MCLVGKSLLLFALEYNGYNSVRGTALSKRARHLAESFTHNGWEVTVVHKDQVNECGDQPFLVDTTQKAIKRVSIKSSENIDKYEPNVFLRKVMTLSYVTFYGDRSYKWAKDAINYFSEYNKGKQHHLIISIFTPRAPLFLGKHFSKSLHIPWIADLQDDIFRGISKGTTFFSALWMKSVLKSAQAIVHVSPEWAEADARILGLNISTIRHGIPDIVAAKSESNNIPDLIKTSSNSFNIFYGGSLAPKIQSTSILKKVIQLAAEQQVEVKIFVAGQEAVSQHFRNELGAQHVVALGWLSQEQMNNYIFSCDCCLLIPLSTNQRIGIPSKFYEYCSYQKPIWIIGEDSGAFTSLLAEWKHPDILFGDPDFQLKALLAAVNENLNNFFNLKNCKGHPTMARDLYGEYAKLLP